MRFWLVGRVRDPSLSLINTDRPEDGRAFAFKAAKGSNTGSRIHSRMPTACTDTHTTDLPQSYRFTAPTTSISAFLCAIQVRRATLNTAASRRA